MENEKLTITEEEKKKYLELAVAKDSIVIEKADFETVIETLYQFEIIDKLIRNRLKELFCAR